MSWWQTQIGFQVLQHGRPVLSLFSVDRLRCGRPARPLPTTTPRGCLRRHRVAPCHYFSVAGCPVIPKFVDRSRSGAALLHFSALHRNLGGPFTAGASSGSHCVRLSCDTSSDTRRLFGGSRLGDIGSWIGRGIDSRQELGGVDYEVEGLARRQFGSDD